MAAARRIEKEGSGKLYLCTAAASDFKRAGAARQTRHVPLAVETDLCHLSRGENRTEATRNEPTGFSNLDAPDVTKDVRMRGKKRMKAKDEG
jgi:hypothetical protein